MIALLALATLLPVRAPLYWSSYEYQVKVDGAIPECEWAANIDWVEKNLKPYGYDMVAIDGWGDEVYDMNGYRTSHSREWKHDYAWWAANLRKRGMKLGIYNNPLWIIKGAADAGLKIAGTDLPIASLLDPGAPGMFNWVEVDRPGAEQYVKGYIRHYARMGVLFLRVDFLSWFETGRDRYKAEAVGKTTRPRAHYETALRWMREACDESGMFLSLVMPNLTNEAALERQYGDMVRINEDAGEGGWWKWSEARRGERLPGWSQWANPVDGLTYWSYLDEPRRLVLDPDFLRMNSFSSDAERRSVVSLCALAGAPIAVADQYNTIGAHLWAYQNQELLSLNAEGFRAKPLSNDPTKPPSQTWVGKTASGDWVVGLFNREATPQARTIEFSSLSLLAPVHVRDLWRHANLGLATGYHARIEPHGCIVLRLSSKSRAQTDSPSIDVPGGVYVAPITVALVVPQGATVRYSTDGADPTLTSPVYRRPIKIAKSTMVRAIAFKPGWAPSEVVSGSYTLRLPSRLPAGWQKAVIGRDQLASFAFRDERFCITSAGRDIQFENDEFGFVYQAVEGDFEAVACVEEAPTTHDWAKVGLMARDGLAVGAPNAFVAFTPGNGLIYQHRPGANDRTKDERVAAPRSARWLRLRRQGQALDASWSLDGSDWRHVDRSAIELPARVLVGIASTSHQPGVLGTATFSHVAIRRP